MLKMIRTSNLFFFLFFYFTELFASNQTIQYLFPVPGSSHVPSGTEVLIRFQDINVYQITNLENFIELTGEKSGLVSGVTTILADHKTIRFLPNEPLKPGETVTMRIKPLLQGEDSAFIKKTCHFTIYDHPENVNKAVSHKSVPNQKPVFDYSANKIQAQDPLIINGISVPSNFPRLNILLSNNPADGFIFINHGWATSIKCHMLLDNTGAPVWYHYSNCWDPRNFKLHKNGEIAMSANHPDSFGDGFISMDNTYSVTDSFWVSWNGYKQNEHELLLLEDGRRFMIGFKKYDIDLSQYIPGALTNVTVKETAIFGYPSGGKSPNFVWRAFDHFDIQDNDEPEIDEINSHHVRFPHMNAIDIDTDGHILLSSRHLSEITKINIETGEIIWQLGGKNSDFTFVDDPLQGPSCQHDIRSLGNHRYTVFDNGNLHTPPISRAAEWELDTDANTATLVWEHRNVESSGNYSNFMGNNQRLPNGNRLINWAHGHNLSQLATEITEEGTKTLEFEFEDNSDVYRIYKYQWNAIAEVPYLVIEVYSDAVTLIFNKFGDTDVDYYNIYGGTKPQPNTVIATSENPYIHLTNEVVNDSRNYFRVTAVNHSGHESGFSNQEDIMVNLIDPGENMINNGDFENGFTDWQWLVNNADADYEITEDHELHFIIYDGGSDASDIQALYPGLSLVNGKKYLFEFDARVIQNRVVYFDVRKNGDPWTNYSQIGGTQLTSVQTHYSFEFIMEEPSEPEACIVLNVGANNSDVYVDNISLQQVDMTKIDKMESFPFTYKLQQNYPNPFNPSTTIKYKLREYSHILLKIFNLSGQEIETLVNGFQTPGEYRVKWTAKGLTSGIYFYRLQAGGLSQTKKLILQK